MKRELQEGRKYDRLTLVKSIKYKGLIYWECLCDCGTRKLIRSDYIRYGRTKSCGCLRVDLGKSKISQFKRAFKFEATSLFDLWDKMLESGMLMPSAWKDEETLDEQGCNLAFSEALEKYFVANTKCCLYLENDGWHFAINGNFPVVWKDL